MNHWQNALWGLLPVLIIVAVVLRKIIPLIAKSKFMNTIESVEWLKEFVMHSAYYGTVIAALMGYQKESHQTAYLAAMWFFGLMYLSRKLTNRLTELEHEEWSKTHRKTAGTTRSIVRYEIERSKEKAKQEWRD